MRKENKNAFFKGKGFYAALTASVAAVFAVGIIGTNMLSNENKNLEQNKQPSSVAEQEESKIKVADAGQEKETQKQQAAQTEENKDNKKETEKEQKDTKEKQDAEITDVTEPVKTAENDEEPMKAVLSNDSKISNQSFDEDAGLLWPVKGKIVLDYSMDKPVYFKTLAQYKCNPALLIAGKKDTNVISAADGVITKIDKNEETGVTITASVGDDYKLIYGQLKDVKVKEGEGIKAGQVIGKLAEPTKYYKEEGTNLFFQVVEGKESVNPLLLLQ